ncbi:MAG: hypothetical protein JWP38_1764 [Herbaspirillum sp.]|nr:hypothetical protein [Herbaspirillum sp.]
MQREMSTIPGSILVTGASGFVGGALTRHLLARGTAVLAPLRCGTIAGNRLSLPDLSKNAQWQNLLIGVDAVVHTAARVHVMNERVEDPLAAFREVNVDGALTLAQQAAEAGVRRFIFISSIKVNGEMTALNQAFSADDVPSPQDFYGISKAEAEAGLQQIARDTDMEVVVIRPPLVYGPGVKANFQSMMRWVHAGIPLPFGRIENRRSFLALDNLIDLITLCIDHPAAANRTFLAADGEDLSTPEWLRRIALALHTKSRLLPVPTRFLSMGASIIGKPEIAQRLCSSLQIDISAARDLLAWCPPLTVADGLRQTAQWFLSK